MREKENAIGCRLLAVVAGLDGTGQETAGGGHGQSYLRTYREGGEGAGRR